MDLNAHNMAPVRSLGPDLKPTTGEQKKLWKTCQDFESVMLSQMFKEMQASVKSDGDSLNQGTANETYREMLSDEQAKVMASAGGIGLADGIYRQLSNQV
jgi:flagellar protein FlgJ